MMGKFLVLLILGSALLMGGGMYYMQVYGYYEPVVLGGSQGENTTDIQLTSLVGNAPETIIVENFQGIDANSSPVRFRACFTTTQSIAMLTETYEVYKTPVPLTGPKWFDCYDAITLGADLEAGGAIAFLSEANISFGIDRVIAVYPDGRAYAWQQINSCGEKVFDGQPAPESCPEQEESN